MPSKVTSLQNYFIWLSSLLSQSKLPDERSLSETVEIPRLPLRDSQTLLEALGYEPSDIEAQCPIPAGTTTTYVDFRIGNGARTWLLDLKSPIERVDAPQHLCQMDFYLVMLRLPVGVLFNGHEAVAVINPQHKVLQKFQSLTRVPVKSVVLAKQSETVSFFSAFEKNDTGPALAPKAKQLANSYLQQQAKDAKNEERTLRLRDAVWQTVSEPTEAIAEAVISASPRLQELTGKPKEIVAIWKALGLTQTAAQTPKSTSKRSLAPQVRALVADVCAAKGFDALKQANIRYLKMRTDGVELKGYRQVPQTPGVPEGLTVRGTDSPKSLTIIEQLRALL